MSPAEGVTPPCPRGHRVLVYGAYKEARPWHIRPSPPVFDTKSERCQCEKRSLGRPEGNLPTSK